MNKKFIKATAQKCSINNHIPAPYIRRSFTLDIIPRRAEFSICGLGFYILYINGINITKGALAPYISNPDHYCYYDTYDLSKYLNKGENVIGIILGNGFFNSFSGTIWDFDKADWANAPCTAVEFRADLGDKTLEFNADDEFKVHSSPIIFDELRLGEYYDANLEIPGWNLPSYDDSSWQNAMPAETPRGEMRLCTVQPIQVQKTLSPISITKHGNGYLYDFGENTAGVCTLQIKAFKGQQITMQYGEILENGEFTNSNILFKSAKYEPFKTHFQKDIYITSGIGCETYTPHFVYHGFRYVLVTGINDSQATKNLLQNKVMNSKLNTIGDFHCSDNTANTLFNMVKRSDLSNFYYFPTDCPHREKNGWTGDASLSADHMVLMYDVNASWHTWLDNIRKSQNDSGALPGIVPTDKWGFAYGKGHGPIWDSVLFNLPYMLYKYRGDISVIYENAHAMLRYLDFITKNKNGNGTVSICLGDLLPVGKQAHEYTTPLEFTDTVTIMDIAKKAAEMFSAVGLTAQANFAKAIYLDMKNAVRNNFIDFDTMTVSGRSQSGQAIGLYYNIFEESERQDAFKVLLDCIHENGDNFDCGILGMHTIFHVLSDFGESSLAYNMITKKDYPSYGHLIEIGETTLPESFMPDGVPCGSHNHHFFGDIGRWFIRCIAGLDIIDCKTVVIRPAFIKDLDSASAYYDLPAGKISVCWERKNTKILLKIICCDNVDYKIILPSGYASQDIIIEEKIQN